MSLLNVVLVVTLAVLALLQHGECQLARVPLNEDPNHPGKCVYLNVPHDVGSEWKESGCQGASCAKNPDGTYLVTLAGCGKRAVAAGCTLVSDNNLQYPACCPQEKCN